MYIKDLSKLIRPLYSKTKQRGQKSFNSSGIELARKIKTICKELLYITLLSETAYKVIKTYASENE